MVVKYVFESGAFVAFPRTVSFDFVAEVVMDKIETDGEIVDIQFLENGGD